jgi:hypothetical protein
MDNFKKNNKESSLFCWIVFLAAVLSVTISLNLYIWTAERDISLYSVYVVMTPPKPAKVEEKIFGYSVKGNPIDGYEIGNGRDAILLIGAIHGNEVGSAYLLRRLVSEIKSDTKIVSKNKKIIIIPVVNPDGYNIQQKFNGNGVNLNLNFDTPGWKNYGPQGTYAGPKPFSEPESQAIKQVVEKYKPIMMISYHTAGGIISPEEGESSAVLGKWYAQKTGYIYYDDAAAIADNIDWNFPGTATMWFLEKTGKPSLTVELSQIDQSDWDINRGALMDIISSY